MEYKLLGIKDVSAKKVYLERRKAFSIHIFKMDVVLTKSIYIPKLIVFFLWVAKL